MKSAYVIGAGLSGLTAGRVLADNGFQVTVVEKRDHIGGNAYDSYEDGILLHQYGPHLFHTNSKRVSRFVQRFSGFIPYEHRVLGEIEGKLVPIPFNFKSIDLLFPAGKSRQLKQNLINCYEEGKNIPIMELLKNPDKGIRDLAEYVFQNVFYGYTKKQWGKPPEQTDPSVMGRVPVRLSYDDRYFGDTFQGVPRYGYARLCEGMARHENIRLRLSEDAKSHLSIQKGCCFFDGTEPDAIIYTGSPDGLLQYRYGRLPYRSLDFRFEKHENMEYFQPAVQVNYPNSHAYTRISEFKRLQENPPLGRTLVSYEYPKECREGDIPFYPVESPESRALYVKYEEALMPVENLYLLGRLAKYQYCNMDAAVEQAMDLAEAVLNKA